MSRLVSLLSLLVPLLATAPLRAEKVAVASFKMTGVELPDTARAALRASLTGGLAAAGFEVLTDDALARAIKDAPGLAGC